jgi:hypothetical protein
MKKMLMIDLVTLAAMAVAARPAPTQEILEGTWKLISDIRTNTTTGATVETFGPKPQGFITYTRDGRMAVLVVRSDRPKPQDIAKITEQERSQLFSSMLAYTGTYKFDGKTIEHQIDLSWNEVWSGTKQIRDVKREGDRLIYTTRPSRSAADGSISIATITWEKVK